MDWKTYGNRKTAKLITGIVITGIPAPSGGGVLRGTAGTGMGGRCAGESEAGSGGGNA